MAPSGVLPESARRGREQPELQVCPVNNKGAGSNGPRDTDTASRPFVMAICPLSSRVTFLRTNSTSRASAAKASSTRLEGEIAKQVAVAP